MTTIRIPLVLLLAAAVAASELTLPITADTSLMMHPEELRQNAGQSSRIKLKGIENVILLAFDPAPVAGKVVERASLRIRGTAAKMMVCRVGLSTVATPWTEGRGDYADAVDGDSCFFEPAPGATWGGPGSSFLDAVWGRGGTIWSQSEVAIDGEQWYTIPIDGRMIEACASGLSHGIALSDDNGQTAAVIKEVDPDSNFSNNFFFSREQGASKPVLTVTLAPAATAAPGRLAVTVAPWPGGADAAAGGLEITWAGPADDAERHGILGYRVRVREDGGEMRDLPRWLLPTVPPVGEPARALLSGWPAGTTAVEVAVVGRGGVVIAGGEGAGAASAPLAAVTPLATVALPANAAGDPPGDAGGSVWAVPDLVKVNPITGNVLEEPGVAYEGTAAGAWRRANPAWSGADRIVRLAALRGEWVAAQIVCDGADAAWTVTPGDLTGPGSARIPAAAMRLSRPWYQRVGDADSAWYADPLLPLAHGQAFAVPDGDNAVPGQRNQTVYAELFVPKDARPGRYAGAITVARGAAAPVAVAVELTVDDALIPDETAFTWSMNAYSSPGEPYGPPESEAFIAAERSFFAVAHEHRANLAFLGYSHSARFQPGIAWPLTGSGADMRVADWSAWDARFGPLFDGSAFAGTPRAGVPMDHFYLPFMESYPTAMADGYRWNHLTFEDHWKEAGAIRDGFSEQYGDQWVAVMRDFQRHVAERGWNKTRFHVYLNNKYFYKQYDTKRGKAGDGTSFWLLDEPQRIDDYLAVAYFGELTREAQQGDRSCVVYRGDVSRPQFGRDTMDRVIDLHVTGGFAEHRAWLEDWRERHGHVVWTYGGAPSSRDSALGIARQAIDLYARGVDGFVPWLTLGHEGNWTAFEDTCVFYTGKPRGIAGACASLRLKAYRRGEQDVEYVRLAADSLGLTAGDPNRRRIQAWIGDALGGQRQRGLLDGQGAVTESFSGLRADQFEQVRRALAALAAGRG
ncbi:MAG TPA: hypothetical protein VEL07_11770 [Planctomycetota bacterium]|nr:hypothetical protein [Planctomycetota bacterium]